MCRSKAVANSCVVIAPCGVCCASLVGALAFEGYTTEGERDGTVRLAVAPVCVAGLLRAGVETFAVCRFVFVGGAIMTIGKMPATSKALAYLSCF